jgi:hypothetical protein
MSSRPSSSTSAAWVAVTTVRRGPVSRKPIARFGPLTSCCSPPVSYVLSSPLAPPPPHADSGSPVPPSAPSEPTGSEADAPAPTRGLSTSVSQESLGSARSTSVSRTKTPVSSSAAGGDPRVWFYCSDTIVKQVSVDEVLRARAYLLFYQRVI